ncbi:MAG: MnhB domain-containing protein [Planctomycetota bacterium]
MSSLLLRTATKLIFPLVLIFAAFIALKGHNEPGGGFIGGLMGAVAFLLYRMTHGRGALLRLLPFHPRVMVFAGLLIALATAVVPMFFGMPFLTTAVVDEFPIGFGQSIHLASAVFFDAGVLLVVVGVSVGMIQRLHEEIDAREAREANPS